MITEMPKQQQLALSASHSRISVGWSHEVNGFFVGLGLLEVELAWQLRHLAGGNE